MLLVYMNSKVAIMNSDDSWVISYDEMTLELISWHFFKSPLNERDFLECWNSPLQETVFQASPDHSLFFLNSWAESIK